MIAFDTDILTLIMEEDSDMVARSARLDPDEFALPIVVVEECLRGRLNLIRQAESRRSKTTLVFAYGLLGRGVGDLKLFKTLDYTDEAERLMQDFKNAKLRVGTQDLRIAAICIAHSATLVTRNRRDFEQIPNLKVEFWE